VVLIERKTDRKFYAFFFHFAHFQNSFLFSLVWSIGASIDTDSRPKFDTFLRDLLTGKDEKHPIPASIGKIDNAFPTDGLVYDFLFEVINIIIAI
jgi:hypothetical protein